MKHSTLLFSILAVSFQFATAQQPGELSFRDVSAFPVGRKGERIRSIIEAINTKDPVRIRSFLEGSCTEEFRNFVLSEAGNI